MVQGRLTVEHEPDGALDRLVVRGDLDFTSAEVLRDGINAVRGDGRSIVLDLSGVEYIDSTGLAQLVWAHSESRMDGWAFQIVQPSEHVRFYIERTGLDRVLPVDGQ